MPFMILTADGKPLSWRHEVTLEITDEPIVFDSEEVARQWARPGDRVVRCRRMAGRPAIIE